MNYLYHTGVTGLTCMPGVGGMCQLNLGCSNYANLWSYSFKVQFNNTANYMIVPLSTIAAQNANGKCDLYLQFLDELTQPMSGQIVLGSMFLQQYVNYWQYNYTAGQQ